MVGSIRNCKSRSVKGGELRFFTFPTNEAVANEWLRYCKSKTTAKNGRVCSNHFPPSDYIRSLQNSMLNEVPGKGRTLKPNVKYLHYKLVVSTKKRHLNITEEVNCDIEMKCEIEPSDHMYCSPKSNSMPVNEVAGSNKVVEESGSTRSSQAKPEPLKRTVKEFDIVINVENSDKTISISQSDLLIRTASEYHVLRNMERSNKTVRISVAEHNTLTKTADEFHVLKNKLEKIFTPGQIRCLMNSDRHRIKWSDEDMAAAIALRKISPKGYHHLRVNVGFPLPAFSTIRKWVSKRELKEGILDDATLIKFKAECSNELEKFVTLSFDEIYLSNKIDNDEQVIGPQNSYQCVAHDLYGKWKQPIYLKCDEQITKNSLLEIIEKLYEGGLTVVSVTCDMRPDYRELMESLNIGVGNGQQTYFYHPINSNLKVHVFFDVSRLLKLARNHFTDNGFVYNNKLLLTHTILKILILSGKEILGNKIGPDHLHVEGSQRQNVRTAAQLFSNTVANAIESHGIRDLLPDDNWLEMSYIFKLFNDWFDIFNARKKFEGPKTAYGIKLDEQNLVLDKMNHLMEKINTDKNNTNETAFQNGILVSNVSLVNLLNDLKGRNSKFEFILTSRLNQEVLA